MDIDLGPKIASGVSPPPSNSSDKHSPVPLKIVGIESPRPDPRWPSKFRWSEKSAPPPTPVVESPPSLQPPQQATGSPLVGEPSPAESTRTNPSPVLVGSSPRKITDFFCLKSKSTVTAESPISSTALISPIIAEPLTSLVVKASEEPTSQLPHGSSFPVSSMIPEIPSVSGPPVQPPLKGAWAKKLRITNSSVSQQDGRRAPLPKNYPPDSSEEDNLRFPWAAKMDPAARNLYRATSPEYLEDGTPKVTIPSHVMMQGLENQKEYVIAPWSTAETFDIPAISTIPVWVTLKNIPHRLYSISGISHIASGLGAPMATYKPRLDPSLMGEAKILVEVELSKAFPPRIAAADKKGNIFMINVEYSWIPTKCGDCGQLGHKASRCMNPVMSKEGVTNSCTIITPVIVVSEVIAEPTIDPEVAPIQEVEICNSVAECHTNVEAELVTETISIAEIRMDTEEAQDNVRLFEREESIMLPGNRFSRLGSSFSDGHRTHSDGDSSVSDDSDNEFDLLVSMTPSGQRILRERPVQPSIKAMEVQASSIARGRGNRGRGHRGRRGRGNGGRG
ncbi:Zinc knuckle CX2CX4HX4C [Arabidopsis thaliana x Arabidopsis arenosa]|uniref:Zinc knuckle CX2CX4HX4C n=2 Tax=Arabidopsis TaxID=3701 RepID=A0A8T1Y3M6_9BRAS|nr:Zinc knuckle CX2CX4HX4C [Arabidopsis thaliana x Arabidopsis arenosa]